MSQGASSAYGAVRIQTDLDISDILNICSKPDKIEDRVKLIKQYGTKYPEFKSFLVVAYFCRDAFSQLLSIGPLDYIPSKAKKGGSVENLKSMWREVTKMYDTFPTGPRVKRGRAQRVLGELYIEDAKILYKLLTGKFNDSRINELVVRQAFPELVPKK